MGPGNDLSEEPASGYESGALESETPPLVTLGLPLVKAVRSLCQVGTGLVTKTPPIGGGAASQADSLSGCETPVCH